MDKRRNMRVTPFSPLCLRLGISLMVLVAAVPALARAAEDFTIVIFGDSQNQVRVDVDPNNIDPNDPGFSFVATDPSHPKSYYEGYTWLPEQPFWFKRDTDGDGKLDPEDNCPRAANPNQEDDDQNGIGNVCDGCPSYTQTDSNQTVSSNPPDGIPDECRCGDVSQEGGFDGTDILMNQNCFLGLAGNCDPAIADTDNDGVVDGTDVLQVQNAFLGLSDACDLVCERSGDPNTPDTRPACNP